MSAARVTVDDNHINMDGKLLAICVNEEAAAVIALCINTHGSEESCLSYPYANDEQRRVQEFFA